MLNSRGYRENAVSWASLSGTHTETRVAFPISGSEELTIPGSWGPSVPLALWMIRRPPFPILALVGAQARLLCVCVCVPHLV